MSDTLSRSDTDAISHLDFKPVCGTITVSAVGGETKCEDSAAWMAILPCCGRNVLFCHPHSVSRKEFRCRGCGTCWPNRAAFRWVML